MKNLFWSFFVFAALAQAQQNSDMYISIDQTSYSVNQLVQDVLVSNQCATLTNVVFSTGTNFGSTNGIGYFSGLGTSFPFEEGVILTTGDAIQSSGPETGSISAGDINWPGDVDLANAVPDHNLSSSYNATFIQFDFIPQSSLISFNFIFASDEYGTYQCQYTDAFAFLLTDNVTGATTNLALVPGTSDPISVLSVRDDTHNSSCSSVNEDFFGAYYGSTGLPEIQSPTNYRGHTVVMAAESPVLINRSYTIKLVIADALDNLLDAAVFLEAGSFDLGQELLDISVCEYDSVQFEAPFYEEASYSWIGPAGFTSNIQNPVIENVSLINQGEYFLEISINDECAFTSSLTVNINPAPEDFPDVEIDICNYLNIGDLLYDYPNTAIYDSPNSSEPLNPSTTLLPGVYYVSQFNEFNCKSPSLISVNMNCLPIIPNAFSPNNDGFNDYFNIKNLYNIHKNHNLKIFNRYGTLIYEGHHSKKWYGHSESTGEIVPVGTYFYSLELNNSTNDIFTGWVYVNY